jgi:hypothetical protein
MAQPVKLGPLDMAQLVIQGLRAPLDMAQLVKLVRLDMAQLEQQERRALPVIQASRALQAQQAPLELR